MPHQNKRFTLRIHLLRNLQGIRIGQIRVGWGYCQDEAILFGDKLHEHISDLELDVGGLIPHRDFGHAWEIHQRQVQDYTQEAGDSTSECSGWNVLVYKECS